MPTRVPFNRGNNAANPTAPDITIAPTHLANCTTWETMTKMSSDHLPIIITINTASDNKKHSKSFTNFGKADWEKFQNYIEDNIAENEEETNPHKLNKKIVDLIHDFALHAPKFISQKR